MPSSVDQNSIRRRGVGLIASDEAKVTPGYVLIAPLTSNQVHLIDVKGETAQTYRLPYRNGRHARMLDNGNLAVNSIDPLTDRPFWFFNKYGGGIMIEIEPSTGKVLRQHRDPLQHHDAHHYGDGSGRILYTTLEQLDPIASIKVKGGVPGSEAPDGSVYADIIKEVDGQGRTTWQWRASEHLNRATFPLQAPYPREHWPLINSVLPLQDGNILVSLRSVSAVLIISRQDGSVLWHLDSTVVAQQHCATEVLPSGNILIFDNGAFRHHESFQYTRALEVDRATKKIVWQWTDPSRERFYTPFMGGAQRLASAKHVPRLTNGHLSSSSNGHALTNGHAALNSHSATNGVSQPNGHSLTNGHSLANGHSLTNGHTPSSNSGHPTNGNGNGNSHDHDHDHGSDQVESAIYRPHGNTLLTESAFGRIVEIDDEDNVCWEWFNPHFSIYEEEHVRKVFPGESNALFRSYKYPPETFPWLVQAQEEGRKREEIIVEL